MMSELKPCPFCGGEARISSDYSSELGKTRWWLWHECCEHDGESRGYGSALFPWFETPWYDTEQEAVDAWNTRAERTCKQKRLFNLMSRECDGEYYEWHGEEKPNYCPNCGAKVVEQ